jgi:hypothetical protein
MAFFANLVSITPESEIPRREVPLLPKLPVRATYLRQLEARKPIHGARRSVVTEE